MTTLALVSLLAAANLPSALPPSFRDETAWAENQAVGGHEVTDLVYQAEKYAVKAGWFKGNLECFEVIGFKRAVYKFSNWLSGADLARAHAFMSQLDAYQRGGCPTLDAGFTWSRLGDYVKTVFPDLIAREQACTLTPPASNQQLAATALFTIPEGCGVSLAEFRAAL